MLKILIQGKWISVITIFTSKRYIFLVLNKKALNKYFKMLGTLKFRNTMTMTYISKKKYPKSVI